MRVLHETYHLYIYRQVQHEITLDKDCTYIDKRPGHGITTFTKLPVHVLVSTSTEKRLIMMINQTQKDSVFACYSGSTQQLVLHQSLAVLCTCDHHDLCP